MEDINEIKVVHREETFNDLAVREIAKSRSICICRLQFGSCKKKECAKCVINHRYKRCLSEMNEYDKLRLTTYVGSYYKWDSLYPEKWMSFRALKKHFRRWLLVGIFAVVAVFIPLLLLCGCGSNTSPRPEATPGRPRPHNVSADVDIEILDIILAVQDGIFDINNDGLVNCMDYSLLFKCVWDRMYPTRKDECILVRNYSSTMNHLFIGVFDGSFLVFVEPQAPNPWITYEIEDIWGSAWKPKYNFYDETEEWMSEVRVR